MKSSVVDNYLDFKFLTIGDSGVGKTCFLYQYVDRTFMKTTGTTVGIDIRDKNIVRRSNRTNKSYNIHLQLWDTAGQERYRSLTTSFFRDAIGFLLIFDLTNEASFVNVRNWITEIQSNAYSENVDVLLVGNKCDLKSERIITKERAYEFAKQHNVTYLETSALKNINIDESVELLLDIVISHYEDNEITTIKNRHLPQQSAAELLISNPETKRRPSYCCNY